MARVSTRSSDSLDLYLRDIASTELLSQEEEVRLARQIRAGSREARNRLVAANLRFVVRIAREYRHSGLPLTDLISAGNVGLISAAQRFDETRGLKFITYAVWWIRQAIQQSLSEDVRMIRLPVNRLDLLRQVTRTSQKLRQINHKEPVPGAIAREMDIPEEKVHDILAQARNVWSLDVTLREDAETSLLHTLPDHIHPPPDAEAQEASDRERLNQILNTLDHREAQVLRLHYGLDGGEPLTLSKIGKRFNLTRERVRQIEARALRRLRGLQRRILLTPLLDRG